MRFFKDYTLKWWEVGLLKASLFGFGTMVGAYYSDFVKDNLLWIAVLVLVMVTPVVYVSFFNQK